MNYGHILHNNHYLREISPVCILSCSLLFVIVRSGSFSQIHSHMVVFTKKIFNNVLMAT